MVYQVALIDHPQQLLFLSVDSAENNVRKQCKSLKLTTRKSSNTKSAESCHHSQLVTVIPHDLMGPSAPAGTRSNKDKAYERATMQPEHRTPPAHQRRVNSSFEQFWHATDFRQGQTSQEMGCLVRKSSSPCQQRGRTQTRSRR